MYRRFKSLSEEKKKRILDACIAEFAQKGYEGASTNEIVIKAGISKGILFHYFQNKRNLYLFVIDHIMEYVNNSFYSDKDKQPDDLIERVMHRGRRKLKFAYEEPLIYELIYKAFLNTPEELKEELKSRYDRIFQMESVHFFKGIDISGFRSDIEPQKVFEAVLLFSDGLYGKYQTLLKGMTPDEALKHMDKLMEEVEVFLDILGKGIYKNQSIY